MREMVSDKMYFLEKITNYSFRSVGVVFALMSGVGLKTRSSIVMVKIAQLLFIKRVMESSLYLPVRGFVENVNHKKDQREFAVNCAHLVMVL